MNTDDKHVHFDKIVAKVNSMDLVVFYNDPEHGWVECMEDFIDMHPDVKYFLCIPKHKEAVLHGLNGGEFQVNNMDYSSPWYLYSGKWRVAAWYMLENHHSRIKPLKEKRWISWNTKLGIIASTYKSKPESIANHQIIEIEVEV